MDYELCEYIVTFDVNGELRYFSFGTEEEAYKFACLIRCEHCKPTVFKLSRMILP